MKDEAKELQSQRKSLIMKSGVKHIITIKHIKLKKIRKFRCKFDLFHLV